MKEIEINAALAELSTALISQASIDDIAFIIEKHAKRITGSEFGFVGYIDPHTGYLVCPTMTRDIWDKCMVDDKAIIFKEFVGLWGWVLKNKKSLISNYPAFDPRSTGTPPGHIPIKRFLSAPALTEGKLVGQIALANSHRNYTEEDRTIIERLADFYALSIQYQRREEQIRKLSHAVEQTSSTVVITDTNGNIEYVNPRFTQLTGYTFEEVRCKNPRILKSGRTTPEEYKELWKTITSGSQWRGEFQNLKKNGQLYWESASISPLRNEEGAITHYIALKEDITKEKEAEEQIKKDYFLQTTINSILHISLEPLSLEKLMDIILEKVLSVPWLSAWQKGCIYLVDDKSHSLVIKAYRGFSQSQLTMCSEIPIGRCLCGQSALTGTIIFVDSRDKRHTICYHNMQSHGHYCVPVISGTKTLGILCVYVNKDHGRSRREEEFLSSVVSTVAGIIERKRAEEALRYERDFAESLIETAQVIVLVLNKEGKIMRFNPYLEEISGYKLHEIQGEDWFDIFIPEQDREHIRKVFINSISGIQTRGTINPIITKKGQERIIEWYDKTLKDREGNTIGVLATGQDITERRKAEKALEKTHQELRDSQAQLVQAEKMSAVGTLVAGVAHEMNNPLMGILNFAQYALKHTSDNKKVHIVLQDLERETERCIEIVQNLLTFSHISDRNENEYKKENCTVIVERILQLLEFRIEKENVVITQNISSDIPPIPVNSNDLQQVLLNIMTNALDALKERREKKIYIDMHHDDSSFYITISDSGCGVAPEYVKKVFDPFFTTKPVGKGTGLGLSVSHNIIKAHAGELVCTSVIDKGTTFKIVLPLEREG